MSSDHRGPVDSSTGQAPVFLNQARDVVRMVEHDASPEGRSIHHEAVELTRFFERWRVEQPTNQQRVAAIQRLLDLSRRVMEHTTRNTRP
jgi:hypothetical protein